MAFQMNTLQYVNVVQVGRDRDTLKSCFLGTTVQTYQARVLGAFGSLGLSLSLFCAHPAQGTIWKCLLIVIAIEKKIKW